jgi:hypothetical protein
MAIQFTSGPTPAPGSIKLPGSVTINQTLVSNRPAESAAFKYEITGDTPVRFLLSDGSASRIETRTETIRSAAAAYPHTLTLTLLATPGGGANPATVQIDETVTPKNGPAVHNSFVIGILK